MPATKAIPKELLPIVDKPRIQYALEKAIEAGIDTLIFVTGRNKRAIEDHFDNNQELEMALRAKGKDEQADMVKNILHQTSLISYAIKDLVLAVRSNSQTLSTRKQPIMRLRL